MRKAKRMWETYGVSSFSVVGLIVIWQLLAMAMNDKFLLPSATQVGFVLANQWEFILLNDLPVSLVHFLIGLGAGMLIAMPIGMAMGWSRIADQIFDPVVEIFRPIPPLAWIPFAIIWLGLTPVSAGFIVFVGALFPILTNTYMGFKSLPRVYVESAKVLGCTKGRDLIWYVALPYALPSIAAGIRIAMGIAWMCIVAGEMFVGKQYGLGYGIWHNYSLQRMDYVVLYMIILGMVGLVFDRAFRYTVEEKLLKWQVGLTQE